MKFLAHFMTIIIHITVLPRDPTEWRESHCDKCGGNTNKKESSGS